MKTEKGEKEGKRQENNGRRRRRPTEVEEEDSKDGNKWSGAMIVESEQLTKDTTT